MFGSKKHLKVKKILQIFLLKKFCVPQVGQKDSNSIRVLVVEAPDTTYTNP